MFWREKKHDFVAWSRVGSTSGDVTVVAAGCDFIQRELCIRFLRLVVQFARFVSRGSS